MERSSVVRRAIATSLVAAIMVVGVGRDSARAMLAPAGTSGESAMPAGSSADLDRVRTFLQQKVVRQRLQDLGLSQTEVESRLARLNETQLQQVALHIDRVAPAGDAAGVVVTVLVIGILALLFLHLLDRL